ncbi:protein kinase, putative [Bodo saltans]|uniref:non-specific serine/threonine protein kinase n=1 Tax=Bodo saltans TaxID=75058 RepID=A0A0S4IRU8_BODSA|nr:protein kinase, putative [Bodo saltans]|eukprot:CUF42246.1 protein kinase, putative [Bodo saltans]
MASSEPSTPAGGGGLRIPENMHLTKDIFTVSNKVLGEGGFAKVYSGELLRDPRRCNEEPTSPLNATNFPKPVAVKVMFKAQVSRSTFSSLQAEIDICSTLRHTCLINTYGVFEDPDRLFIVMDLAEGGELLKYMKQFGLEDMPVVAPNLVGEVVLGLEHMREHGVVHRDIKPENLLLTAEYHVKISDFGTVCRVDDEAANKFTGTAFYVSPEVLATGKAGYASDLWALGCCIFQMFVGRPPFQGESQYLVMQKIKERNFEFPPYFPADAKDLVDKLLTVDPLLRLGGDPEHGFAQLKAHPFFRTVNWETILLKSNVTHLNANYTKKWEAFLLKDERVIYSSLIVKERYSFLPSSTKMRMLILTDFPRLFYLEPDSLAIKGQVAWSDEIFAQSDSAEKFTVHTPGREYIFVDSEKRAALWASKINDQVKRKKK